MNAQYDVYRWVKAETKEATIFHRFVVDSKAKLSAAPKDAISIWPDAGNTPDDDLRDPDGNYSPDSPKFKPPAQTTAEEAEAVLARLHSFDKRLPKIVEPTPLPDNSLDPRVPAQRSVQPAAFTPVQFHDMTTQRPLVE
jgi:hypothetical protein